MVPPLLYHLYSHLSCLLRSFLLSYIFLAVPCASVWENTRARVPLFPIAILNGTCVLSTVHNENPALCGRNTDASVNLNTKLGLPTLKYLLLRDWLGLATLKPTPARQLRPCYPKVSRSRSNNCANRCAAGVRFLSIISYNFGKLPGSVGISA